MRRVDSRMQMMGRTVGNHLGRGLNYFDFRSKILQSDVGLSTLCPNVRAQ